MSSITSSSSHVLGGGNNVLKILSSIFRPQKILTTKMKIKERHRHTDSCFIIIIHLPLIAANLTRSRDGEIYVLSFTVREIDCVRDITDNEV